MDYFVNQSWKNAAADICSMLKRVRKSGLMDVQEMEEKLQGMTEAMNEQDTKLATLVGHKDNSSLPLRILFLFYTCID